jgi:hypothetical protein
MEIKTKIKINAPAEKIWNKLMDFNDYPNWNPFILSIEGIPKIDNNLVVNFEKMTFKPRVISLVKNKEFKWVGKLLFKGIFDGEHSFQLVEITNNKTLFIHSEEFSGILVPLLKKKLLSETKPGFESMNLALKKEMESV